MSVPEIQVFTADANPPAGVAQELEVVPELSEEVPSAASEPGSETPSPFGRPKEDIKGRDSDIRKHLRRSENIRKATAVLGAKARGWMDVMDGDGRFFTRWGTAFFLEATSIS